MMNPIRRQMTIHLVLRIFLNNKVSIAFPPISFTECLVLIPRKSVAVKSPQDRYTMDFAAI
jgi:hypothetical protein